MGIDARFDHNCSAVPAGISVSRRHRRRAGRKRNLDPAILAHIAADSPTVRAAMRRAEPDRGTPELRAHRRHAAFNGENAMAFDGTTASITFPLTIMRQRGLIDVELHDAGMRFAALAWALFGEPFAGCEALYERMVGSTDRTPSAEPDPERRAMRRRLHENMLAELQRRDPVLNQPIESGRMRHVVTNVCQYAHMPRWLVVMIEGTRASDGKMRYRLSDAIERGLLIEGLTRLAAMERQRSPRRAA